MLSYIRAHVRVILFRRIACFYFSCLARCSDRSSDHLLAWLLRHFQALKQLGKDVHNMRIIVFKMPKFLSNLIKPFLKDR